MIQTLKPTKYLALYPKMSGAKPKTAPTPRFWDQFFPADLDRTLDLTVAGLIFITGGR
uniref:Uncharacterized protein n=1 Tax=Candidozyma auris TaxID=498019 RepID=A0A0L0P5J4_CANAR